MLPGRLPAIWPDGATRDGILKDHAMRGRKRKPTALKLLDDIRADRINRNEPVIPHTSIEPPGALGGAGTSSHIGRVVDCRRPPSPCLIVRGILPIPWDLAGIQQQS
jgi:hypothetical protein